jgi:hypothetical protein
MASNAPKGWSRYLHPGGFDWLGDFACDRCGVTASTPWQRRDHELEAHPSPELPASVPVHPDQLDLFAT